jgi:integrase
VFDRPRYAHSKPRPKVRYIGRTFHDLRRSGVRGLIRAGVDRDTAKRISGHKSDSVFSRYHISRQDIINAAKLLDVYNRKMARDASRSVHNNGTLGSVPKVSEIIN